MGVEVTDIDFLGNNIRGNNGGRWFQKFQNKFRRDPDFLTRDAEKI